ncbi:MAG: glycosyltransferase [Lachnospiraceae bacterium]|nr:glycosyltransferase [Lachnospiraceae bacterium]
MNTPLSICLIAKNEEQHIGKCLEALAPLKCEIVLADTGSDDRTPAIASAFTDQICSIPWTDDFAAARNAAAAKASNDLILFVDCDEYLREADIPALDRLLDNLRESLGVITLMSPFRRDGEERIQHEHITRLYDRRRFRWQGRIHENIVPTNSLTQVKHIELPLIFYHAGYVDEDTLHRKAERDLKLLLDQLSSDGEDPYLCFQAGQCYSILGDKETAAQYFRKGLSFDVDPRLAYVRDMVDAYGYALLDLQRYREALGLEAVRDSFAGRADFLFLLGLIYMNNARFDDAIAAFTQATETPLFSVEGVNSYRARYNIGVINEVRGDKEKAIAMYRACGDYAPAISRLAALCV